MKQPGEETVPTASSFARSDVRGAAIVPCAGVAPGPPETKRKRAPKGTFDRNAYQREYMRKRRQKEKTK